MAQKGKKVKPIAKFEVSFRAFEGNGEDASCIKEMGLVFERTPRTGTYKPLFIMRNAKTGLNITLPLPEGSYESVYELLDGLDPSNIQKYVERFVTMVSFFRA